MTFLKRHWAIPLFVLVSIFFYAVPQFDLWVAGLFWQPEVGFELNQNPVVQFIYVVFRYMPHFLVPALLILLILPWFKPSLKPSRKYTGFLLVVLLVGPGIIVHPILKDNWDRPRPRDIQQFGGQAQFSPAFVMADEPGNNQSFASGHAAMGFFFMAFAWVLRQRRYLLGGLLIGAIVSLGRIVQGGHFVSDIVTAGFIVYFTCQVFAHYMLGDSRIKPDEA
ncbi:MAG: lipid A 4'-phosphatase [Bermanella sp.]|jgi:lipid A 4'-phosphatase